MAYARLLDDGTLGYLALQPTLTGSSTIISGKVTLMSVYFGLAEGASWDAIPTNAIRLVNLSESVTTMYPLMEPAMEDLASQILASQSTENLAIPESQKFTANALLQAIEDALAKAR